MLPRVIAAKPRPDFQVEITFDNHETKIFDVRPYLELGIFTELKDRSYFDSIRVEDGTITWKNGQDFSPDTLYLEGKITASSEEPMVVREIPPENYGDITQPK